MNGIPLIYLCLVCLFPSMSYAQSATQWNFGLGSEFPGAKGSMALDPDGFDIRYDFSSGGKYVEVSTKFPQPAAAEAIRFKVNSASMADITIHAVDESGQTLEFRLKRPFDVSPEANGYEQTVSLLSSGIHWNGANDGKLHGGITQIAFHVSVEWQAPQGSAKISHIEFLSQAPVFQLQARPAQAARESDPLANLTISVHNPNDESLAKAQELGFKWARTDLFWNLVEKKTGVYDFSGSDAQLERIETHGMKMIFILDYTNNLYVDQGKSVVDSETSLKKFGDFAEAAARHYTSRPVIFELWNEPNYPNWGHKPPSIQDAAQYSILWKEVEKRIHAVNPQAELVTGGLTSIGGLPYMTEMLATGGGRNGVGISMHPYTKSEPEFTGAKIEAYRRIIEDAHMSISLISTECGYSTGWYGKEDSTGLNAKQALFDTRMLLTHLAMRLPRITFYDLTDDGADPADSENRFGILTRTDQEKPVTQALRIAIGVLKGKGFPEIVSTPVSSLHVLRFGGQGDSLYVLWLDQQGETMQVSIPPPVDAKDMYGGAVNRDAWGNLTLSENSGPLYLTYAE